MQPCAPMPWLDRKQQASPLPSLTFYVSLQAEARFREETASGLGCRVSANSRTVSRCSLLVSKEPHAFLPVLLLGKYHCWDVRWEMPPSLPRLPFLLHHLPQQRLTFVVSLLSLPIKPNRWLADLGLTKRCVPNKN